MSVLYITSICVVGMFPVVFSLMIHLVDVFQDGAVLELTPAADSMETDGDTDSQLVLHPNYSIQE